MRGDTAIGHVDAHNELRSGLLREAERFGIKIDVGGPYAENDPGHVQEHEKTRIALELLAKTAGIQVALPPTRKLGDHDHAPTDHDSLDLALDLISKADAWNDATGGTITDYTKDGKRYRRHTFLSSGIFTVTRAVRPYTVYLLGGGGGGGHGGFDGGGPHGGGNGGGGGYYSITKTLTSDSYPVTVGTGGAPGGYGGAPGGNTSAFTFIAGGGGGGCWGQDAQTGGDGLPGTPTEARGGNGGGANHAPSDPCAGKQTPIGLPSSVANGGRGGGASTDPPAPTAGQGGAVVVDYQIGVSQ